MSDFDTILRNIVEASKKEVYPAQDSYNVYESYEREKSRIKGLKLTQKEYDAAIRELIEEMGI